MVKIWPIEDDDRKRRFLDRLRHFLPPSYSIIRPMTINNTVLGSILSPIGRALERSGVDADALFSKADIHPEPSEPARIPMTQYLQLMESCLEATGHEDFGLKAAMELQPQDLRSLGLGWLASDSVLDGLRRLTRFNRMVTSLSEVTLQEGEELVAIEVGKSFNASPGYYASRDYGVGVIVRMCRLTLGEYLAPLAIELQRPAPRDPRPWTYQLGAQVQFNSDAGRITWVRSDIEGKLPTGNPQVAHLMDENAAFYLQNHVETSIQSSIISCILRRLPDGPPSLTVIADDVSMSPRTLQRRLAGEGTNFDNLLQQLRSTMAQQYLRQNQHTIQQIAYLLGFSEASAFSRAFKRWTGHSPGSFQKNHHDATA